MLFRLRVKWTEAGEKKSSYFSKLEKSRHQRNVITSLLINGTECKDFREIEVFTFYSKLSQNIQLMLTGSVIRFSLVPCIDILTNHLNICVTLSLQLRNWIQWSLKWP